MKSLNLYEKVKSFRKASSICRISKSTIHRWWTSLHCKQRNIIPKTKTKRKSKFHKLKDSLQLMFSEKYLKFYSLKQIRESLNNINEKPSIATLHRYLKKTKISRRKFDTSKVCPRTQSEMNQRYLQFSDQLNKFKVLL